MPLHQYSRTIYFEETCCSICCTKDFLPHGKGEAPRCNECWRSKFKTENLNMIRLTDRYGQVTAEYCTVCKHYHYFAPTGGMKGTMDARRILFKIAKNPKKYKRGLNHLKEMIYGGQNVLLQ